MSVLSTEHAKFNILLNSFVTQPDTYNTAVYCRLSKDDNNGGAESMSIQSQKEMLIGYAQEQGYTVVDIYVDDGYSGTTFNRPDFQRMIQDIKLGKINMVLTKDLSRLGRNYVETGQYTDFFFPQHGVTYIAVNDNIDTSQDNNDIAPFKNILNEMYAQDISRKVKSSRKVAVQQGKFMGSIPPYGYKRSPADKYKLIPDEEATRIVKQIFSLYSNHETARHIADRLNNKNVMNPQTYYYHSISQENPYTKNAKTWSAQIVTSILKNEVYIGNLVQCKKAVQSFKTKKVIQLPPELWQRAENQHEAIIDTDTWNTVQYRLEKNKRQTTKTTADGGASLFANIVYCKDCNSRLVFNSTKKGTKTKKYYRCSRYIQHGKEACTPHRINQHLLSQIVLEDIQCNARLAIVDEQAFIQRLHEMNMSECRAEINRLRKRQTEAANRLNNLDNLIQQVFEKSCSGVISDTVAQSLISKYECEKLELKNILDQITLEIVKSESETKDIQKDVDRLKRCAAITELSRRVVTSLIERITISEPDIVDGEKVFNIEIQYKFQKISNARDTKKDTTFGDAVSSASNIVGS